MYTFSLSSVFTSRLILRYRQVAELPDVNNDGIYNQEDINARKKALTLAGRDLSELIIEIENTLRKSAETGYLNGKEVIKAELEAELKKLKPQQ